MDTFIFKKTAKIQLTGSSLHFPPHIIPCQPSTHYPPIHTQLTLSRPISTPDRNYTTQSAPFWSIEWKLRAQSGRTWKTRTEAPRTITPLLRPSPSISVYLPSLPPTFESDQYLCNPLDPPKFHYFYTAKLASEQAMDVRFFGFDNPILSNLHHLMDVPEETEKSFNAPTRTYVRDAEAMAATPADVKEYPNSYVFVVDLPGLKSGDIKVQVEDDNVLVISGERKREEEKEGAKYLRMERRVGKFMRKFSLPENADTDGVSAVCQDGVLTVTVKKLPPPEPKKPKSIEIKVN